MATSNEDLIASDATEDYEPQKSDDLKCTLCMKLCTKCFNSHQKRCTDVVDVISETSDLSDPVNDIKVQIKELEDHFKRVTDIHVSNLRELDSQINDLTEEIRTLKKSINNVLDDLEIRVKIECAQIYNEERNKLEKLKVGFKSQIMSIRNANLIIDDMSKFASQSQMFQLVKRMLRQLSFSKSQISEKYIANDILKLELETNPQITSRVSIPRGEIATMKIKRNDKKPIVTTGFKP
ncbi:hypothetical protein CHS0354_036261 [Potamilus streckersoni]|uniref:Uncharacterized protein n=1 Tax=Potamilus streckersoni TaxID=2493646 RepID=A0AAE0SVR4_9BIVA|nr:hypothetical protein CHS0354_036261 [Potamilus streckersoni]